MPPKPVFGDEIGVGGFPSGQREQTVNLSSIDYGGSNPPPPTISILSKTEPMAQ